MFLAMNRKQIPEMARTRMPRMLTKITLKLEKAKAKILKKKVLEILSKLIRRK
jgi:hypothetical protein